MDNTCIEQAMDNPGKAFVLAGKTYTFKEPGMRRGREILAAIGLLYKRYPNISGGFSFEQIDIVNDVLDFLYEYAPGVKADRMFLDDKAGAEEILDAFKVVMEIVRRPLSGGRRSTARQETETETSSTSGDLPTP